MSWNWKQNTKFMTKKGLPILATGFTAKKSVKVSFSSTYLEHSQKFLRKTCGKLGTKGQKSFLNFFFWFQFFSGKRKVPGMYVVGTLNTLLLIWSSIWTSGKPKNSTSLTLVYIDYVCLLPFKLRRLLQTYSSIITCTKFKFCQELSNQNHGYLDSTTVTRMYLVFRSLSHSLDVRQWLIVIWALPDQLFRPAPLSSRCVMEYTRFSADVTKEALTLGIELTFLI